jgi:hypothetical protein
MNPFDRAPSFAADDRTDYLPPPPRPAVLNSRLGWWRAGLLAGLLLTAPCVLYLGETNVADLRMLVEQGGTTTASIARRG